jgi:hypothetical protein
MFSDRGWILKAAAALGLLAWLNWDTQRRLGNEFPPLERLAVFTEDLRHRQFHLWAKRVEALDPTGFQIRSSAGPIHIVTPVRPELGDHVSVSGRATGPRTLEATSLRINQGYAWKRPLNYAVSVVTLIAYLWFVRRRFRWRPHEGIFRGRY